MITKTICLVFAFLACLLFLGDSSADYFISTLTIKEGDLNGTTLTPDFPVRFSPDDSLIASQSVGGKVVLWNAKTGKPVLCLTPSASDAPVNGITQGEWSDEAQKLRRAI